MTTHHTTHYTGVPLEGQHADLILRSLLASGRVGDAVRAVMSSSTDVDGEETETALLDGALQEWHVCMCV